MVVLEKNWTSLIKSQQLEVRSDQFDPNLAEIIVEPLERGYGLTLGNALRRILLSSLRGSAITAIKIFGINHELEVINGVEEDIISIILNLKNIVFKTSEENSKTLSLKVKGPCTVTAGMITAPSGSDIEILNKDLVICKITEHRELEMELFCASGRGYTLDTTHYENQIAPLGVINIYAMFSPIRKVVYKVENTRVGQDTDYDRLIMRVETNGTLAPGLAVGIAAKILQDQAEIFINFKIASKEPEQISNKRSFDPVLSKRIQDIDLFGHRILNCLRNANIIYLGDLICKADSEMLAIPNFGAKSLADLKTALSREFNLVLGQGAEGWRSVDISSSEV